MIHPPNDKLIIIKYHDYILPCVLWKMNGKSFGIV
ncbi:hypothetical protein CLOBOL_00766 [Enterocloster bolteae ATCC BAA-613]|uniref:Uncharacterized protein n=1 Tax=Enterocloster bolteae (strain ATCC BAA-613 / DSM 15670 / CCUG 46953 / JCM 12243 / WAL 16351) TaxID=411902 RepID=A8RIR7_ENTBW|nr:hypothetical protein CLOBOL_00766 [Enterocloster bolteae ATCC BAA-613]